MTPEIVSAFVGGFLLGALLVVVLVERQERQWMRQAKERMERLWP
jgi:hypothetical protein